ncbi:MAG: rRNA maturation RNase YbeY [Bdellovibrionaceae bacterium]|nr:rRNA maturation RNase YbeY [Pseudobdellovibrionaceae bacterium]
MQALVINQTTTKLNLKNIQMTLDKVVKRLVKNKSLKNLKKLKKDEITFVLISAPKMKAMNFQFRGKDYATDVLSFAPASPESLGELILCPSVLKKQAKQNGHSLDFEILYMFIHGILHLLGYDHEISKAEEKKMFSLQDRLFSQLTQSKINLHLTHVNRRRS